MSALPDTARAGLVRALGAPLRVSRELRPADAIVILGAALRADGSPTAVLDERIRAGARLYALGMAPIVCVTGGAMRDGGPTEAEVMAARARELGVPDAALRLEAEARNTAENARLSAAILQREGCRRVLVVSQPFHLRRALWLFRKYGLEPLAWHADASIEFTSPNALRWIAREYASVARYLAFEARDVLLGRGPSG